MKRFFEISWVVTESDAPVLLREFLKGKQISKAALTDIKFHGGALFVNEKEVTVRTSLSRGDVVKVHFPPEKQSESMKAESIPLDIVFEDEHFLAVNKPPGMPTIPSLYQPKGSLAAGVLFYYQQHGIPGTFHAVNRLDKDTSGIVLVAKHRYAHSLMSKQQREKTIQREYVALVHGDLEQNRGTITSPIGRNPDSIVERMVREDGQSSITHFEKVRYLSDHLISAVRLKLETGRTHQIRVHMASLGHPLVGDDLYGGSRELIGRQALHSETARFVHPFTGKEILIKVELPADMNRFMS
ncbi:RluA family pseudouridine synthase [Fictibacillus phosphorivorans]|uniref:RluA family pseudouridine synthase n=1 Tax=Fictibacillus phosphorivorans TaxID=1221500 RepID=UPI00203D95F8|nr:RluA family pseudouridine synthase [Fictibacillus phosphorivorans]MCM3719133.1 RluA family pseudouridine synthase [Fictibacillus phosphorivorans]MCM3776755.1 RluA family pseudouridine synthase [Fictibacillus phosphorivorans]